MSIKGSCSKYEVFGSWDADETGRRWVPPAPGMIPNFVSVKPIFVTAKPGFPNKHTGREGHSG